jgi:DNA-binding MarR family transcriptional regulator
MADAPPPGPPLIGALLRMAFETVRTRMLDALHEAGFDDLDIAHLQLIQWPGPDGMRPTDLATRVGISKQAANYLLGELERLGYLERRPDADDGRSRRIHLTDRGRAVIPVIRQAVGDTERDWANAIGRKRFEELRSILVELNGLAAR